MELNLDQLDPVLKKRLYNLRKARLEEFNHFIAGLNSQKSDDFAWKLSPTSSRNVYTSKIFEFVGQILLLQSFREDGVFVHAVSTQSFLFSRVLKRFYSKKSVRVKYRFSLLRCLKFWATPLYCWLKELARLAREWWALGSVAPTKLTEPITLVDVFVTEKSFQKNQFVDRYYDNILVQPGVQPNTFYLPEFVGIENYSQLRHQIQSSPPFLIKNHFLRPFDYVEAMFFPLRIMTLALPACKFRGLDFAPLIRAELFFYCAHTSFVRSYLNFKFVERLKQVGVRVARVINWFENQTKDRALNLGLNTYFPETKTVGYQAFVISPYFNPHTQPLSSERKMGVLPKVFASMGEGGSLGEWLPEIDLKKAPAFRFKGVWWPRNRKSDSKIMLVTLPFVLREAQLMIDTLQQCSEALGEFQIRMKPHPATDYSKLGVSIPNAQRVTESFETLIQDAHILVSGSSTTCLEALAIGVPVIVLSEDPEANPIPEEVSRNLWEHVTGPEDFAIALKKLEGALNNKELLAAEGDRIRQEYFAPCGPESVQAFLYF